MRYSRGFLQAAMIALALMVAAPAFEAAMALGVGHLTPQAADIVG